MNEVKEATIYTFTKETGEAQHTNSADIVVSEMIHRLRHVNPSYKDFFRRKAQRTPLLQMMKEYNLDTLFKLLDILPVTNGEPYAPTITTPLEFRRLAPKLLAFIHKKQNEDKRKWKVTF